MRLPDLSVVTAPAPVVSLAEAKAHLRVDTTDDDLLITTMIAAATSEVDGATGKWFGRALGQQTLLLTAAHFPGCDDEIDWHWSRTHWPQHSRVEISLPCPPVQSIGSVVYIDVTGAFQTIDPATYILAAASKPSDDCRILFPLSDFWPPTARRPDAVSITYVAGYSAGKLPVQIHAALLLRIASLYVNRNDAVAIATTTSDRLLFPLRVWC